MNTSCEYNRSRKTEDWCFTESDRVAVEQGCYFDFDAADRVRRFFLKLIRHSKGPYANKPFKLAVWQWNNVIGPAFGWKMPDGTRRFKEVEIWVPKKNGKSTLMAAIAIYLLCLDGEEGSEVYSAAADRTQASIIYTEAVNMTKKSSALRKALRARKALKELHHDKSNSIYKVLSSVGFRADGINIHGLLFDELHTQQNRKLFASLRYGTAARRQGIKFITSTAGEDDETLLWYERFNLARRVQASKEIDIHLLACVYALEPHEDWKHETCWKRVNPGYGTIVNAVEFRRDFENAKKSSANEVEFLRYRLNKSTKYQSAWIQHHYWEYGLADGKDSMKRNAKYYVGVDLADTVDMNAAVFGVEVEHPIKGPCIRIFTRFWTAEESVNKLNGVNADRYKQWFESGHLICIPGPIASQEVIEDSIIKDCLGRSIECIGIDQYNANRFAYSMDEKFKRLGQKAEIKTVNYNCSTMNNSVRYLEELIYTGRIIHEDDPIMAWQFGNIKCTQDSSGNRKLDKATTAGKKIDGFSALCIMIHLMINLEPKFVSKYNMEGVKPGSISLNGVGSPASIGIRDI